MSTIVPERSERSDRTYNKNNRLDFLDDISGYKVHHDDVDPRGYSVKLRSGETIGEVEGLLADVSAKLVRYVEIEIDDDVIESYTGNHYDVEDRMALVPVGLVKIDRENNDIYVEGMSINHLHDYPRYSRNRGYSTYSEIATSDYLSGFHDYGSDYDRERYSTDAYRNANTLDDGFYSNGFYRTRI